MSDEKILSPVVLDHETGYLCVAEGTPKHCIGVVAGSPFHCELPTVDVMRAMLKIMTPEQLEDHLRDVVRAVGPEKARGQTHRALAEMALWDGPTWTCHSCEFVNAALRGQCRYCGRPRQESV